MDSDDYTQLLVPFDDESQSFTNGFECGQIWQDLENGKNINQRMTHTINRNQLRLICEFFQYEFSFEAVNEDWDYFTAELNILDKLK